MIKFESYNENNFQKTNKSEMFKILESSKSKIKKENKRANTLFPNKKHISNNSQELTRFILNSINKNPSIKEHNESTKDDKYKEISNTKSNTYRYLNSSIPEYNEELNLKQYSDRGKNKSTQETIKNQSSSYTYRISQKKNNFFVKNSNNGNCLLKKIKKFIFTDCITKKEKEHEYKKRLKRVNSSFCQNSIYSFEKKLLDDLKNKNYLFNDSYFNDSNFLSSKKKPKKKIIPKIKSKYLKEKSKYDFKEHPLVGITSIKDFSAKIEKIGKEADDIIDKTVSSKTDETFSVLNKIKFGKNFRSFDIYEKIINIKKVHINDNKRKIINENVYKDYEQCLKYVNEEAEKMCGSSIIKKYKVKNKNLSLEKLRTSIIKISNFLKQRKINEEELPNFKLVTNSFTYPETKLLINAIRNKNIKLCDNLIEDKKIIVLDYDYFLLTPLHWAVKRNFYIFLPSLIDYGSNVNARSITGETPLHIAVKNKFYDCACILLYYLASPFIADNSGKKPIDLTDDFYMLNLMNKINKLHYSSFFHKTFNQDLFIQCGLWAFIKEEFRHKINDEVFNYFNNKKIKDIFILEYQNSSENQSNAKNI